MRPRSNVPLAPSKRSAAEPLALGQTRTGHDVHVRLYAQRQRQFERQYERAAEQLATAQRELRQLDWWSRDERRLELEREIALRQTTLRSLDARGNDLAPMWASSPGLRQPDRKGDELTPSRQLRSETQGVQRFEREPPGLEL